MEDAQSVTQSTPLKVEFQLFVGGPADGKRQNILGELETFQTLNPEEKDRHMYRRFKFAGHSKVFTLYAHESLSPDEIVEKLIEGYKNDQ